MSYLYIWIWIYIFFSIVYLIFIYTFNKKLNKLRKNIINLLYKRTDLVPILYEITKTYIERHDEVFKEILKLRKNEFFIQDAEFFEIIHNELAIHHELNFIFKILWKNPKILKNYKFLYIRDLFLENSKEIWKYMELYKKMSKKYNKYLKYKNITIFWIFLNLRPHTI